MEPGERAPPALSSEHTGMENNKSGWVAAAWVCKMSDYTCMDACVLVCTCKPACVTLTVRVCVCVCVCVCVHRYSSLCCPPTQTALRFWLEACLLHI